MKLKLPILLFGALYLTSAHAEMPITPESIVFKKLENTISKYSDKVRSCASLQMKNKLTEQELASILDSFNGSAPTLSYLSELALNQCLQPEKATLAEVILTSYRFKELNSSGLLAKSISELAESTRKLVFNTDFSDKIDFYQLSIEKQGILLNINSLKSPFNELVIYEQIMNIKE